MEICKVVKIVNDLIGTQLTTIGRKIKANDIGIISPYRSQCVFLQNELRSYTGLMIGTTELFQGSEKPIIIVSTVRSNSNLGFVKEYRVSDVFRSCEFVHLLIFMRFFVFLAI